VAGVAKSVAIPGVGVAGLTTARMLKQYGLDITIYEAKAEPCDVSLPQVCSPSGRAASGEIRVTRYRTTRRYA
jgi:flavin-dependent dehydrogenase